MFVGSIQSLDWFIRWFDTIIFESTHCKHSWFGLGSIAEGMKIMFEIWSFRMFNEWCQSKSWIKFSRLEGGEYWMRRKTKASSLHLRKSFKNNSTFVQRNWIILRYINQASLFDQLSHHTWYTFLKSSLNFKIRNFLLVRIILKLFEHYYLNPTRINTHTDLLALSFPFLWNSE